MKTLLPFLLVFFLFACSRSNDNTSNPRQQTQAVTSGSWRVTLFADNGGDETGDFAGYSFQFLPNGTITATRSGATKSGTWSLASSSDKFIVDLGAKTADNKPFGELTDDWQILSITTTEIKLADDNASSGELLTFTKN